MRVLALFDIDGTLLRTEGEAVQAMIDVGVRLFGDTFTFDGVPVAGRLDPLILRDVFDVSGIVDGESHLPRFQSEYHERLLERLAARPATIMPGVAAMLDRCEDAEMTLGLVTGNWAKSGLAKIADAGVDPARFSVQAWGDDGRDRAAVAAAAIRRHAQAGGCTDNVIIIGDTVHDIACAHANGARAIGVCTGGDTRDALEKAGGDLVVDDLSGTEGIISWMMAT
jgi:phosphoglycolate phosphatase-like HAD superfamily hydrolase